MSTREFESGYSKI